MKDYHIYVHAQGTGGQARSPVNPRNDQIQNHAAVEQPAQRNYREQAHSNSGIISTGKALAAASRINGWVGELTENRVQQRRISTGLTIAGLAAATVANPVLGLQATAMYFIDKTVSYGIKVHKENLSADYLKQLSGGTVKTGR